MYRVFVLILIGSLVLPAVPVAGCECSQQQSSGQASACCCSKSASSQTQKQKSCCSQAAREREKQNTSGQPQIQRQKQGCQCQKNLSQPATATPIKSTELARQLRDQFESVDLTVELCYSVRPASSRTFELPPPELSYSSGEFCAHFCLWQI
ncbi:MAG: hypothetical protein KDA77_05160 [Planctomycetaceae bacterium]|nr:hypothetical protein [Planctomycetaceae bacterium]